ncbi:hypothetical protein FACS1894111_06140 [Clostridia bacterium]|nr:hypothetical protein FACS1894111_06140 [Clostridia bacterium]
MDIKSFRFLFEPTPQGLVHSGCIQDSGLHQTTNYIYLCSEDTLREDMQEAKTYRANTYFAKEKSSYSANTDSTKEKDAYSANTDSIKEKNAYSTAGGSVNAGNTALTKPCSAFLPDSSPCHLLVLATFSTDSVQKLLFILQHREVKTLVLPYLPLEKRLHLQEKELMNWQTKHNCQGESPAKQPDTNLATFLKTPYSYLKSLGVEQIYFLSGNGDDLTNDYNLAEKKEIHISCPPKRSNTKTANLSNLTQNSSSPKALPPRGISSTLDTLSNNPKDGHFFETIAPNDLEKIQTLESEYIPVSKAGYLIENATLFYFGCYEAEIVMAQVPLSADPRETDCLMAGKAFAMGTGCRTLIEEEKDCMIRCLHRSDHDSYRRHKDNNRSFGCFGMLLLGNVNLKQHFPDISNRFSCLRGRIRTLTLPNGTDENTWNCKLLTWLSGEDTLCWIFSLELNTSKSVIADIVISSPRNQAVCLSPDFGYCFSGYFIKKQIILPPFLPHIWCHKPQNQKVVK